MTCWSIVRISVIIFTKVSGISTQANIRHSEFVNRKLVWKIWTLRLLKTKVSIGTIEPDVISKR